MGGAPVMDLARPWTYRQPLLQGETRGRTPGDFLVEIAALAEEAPLPWRDGAATLAREWLTQIGVDADSPREVRAYLLGCGLLNPCIDLCIGLLVRMQQGGG